jgi:hypothetical protein
MVVCGIGFSEAWRGVQWPRKRPPAGNSHQGPNAPLAHLDLAIPCRVASQQSPTPLHQAKPLYHGREQGARAPWKQKDEDCVDERRLHWPFLWERALADAYASLSAHMDLALLVKRTTDKTAWRLRDGRSRILGVRSASA